MKNGKAVSAFLSIICSLSVHMAMGDTYRFNAAASSDWMNGFNWQNQTAGINGWQVGGIPLPGANDTVRFNYAGSAGTLAADAGTVDALQIGVDESGSLSLNAGASLTTDSNNWSGMGAGGASTGGLTINGGLLTVNNGWNMGWNTSAHNATLEINGGEMRVVSGGFNQTKATTTALTTLNGGLLHVNALTLSAGVIDIAGGTLKVDADVTGSISGWETAGRMKAFGGAAGATLDAVFTNGVTLITALAVPLVSVPDVTGLPQATAEADILSAGLTIGNVTTILDPPGVAAGEVYSQTPAGGTNVAAGSAIDLVVAVTIPEVTVPDVTGTAQAAAESGLIAAGLVIGSVTTVSSGGSAGHIYSQNPAGGETVTAGSSVDLVVVVQPGVAQVPSHDVNLDGLDDLIHVARDGDNFSAELLLSDGSAFSKVALTGSTANHASQDKWFQGDFDGDGRMDLARLWGGADGNAYCEVETTLTDGSLDLDSWAAAQGPYAASQRWFRGDFDGDGRDDLLEMPSTGTTLSLNVYRSTGSGFVRSSWWSSSNNRAQADWFFVNDVTGDGAEDFIRVYESGGDVVCRVYSVNGLGTGFVQSNWGPAGYAYVPDHRWYPGDYNGDGKGDFAVLRSDDGEAKVDLILATPTGFAVQADWVNGGEAYTYGEEMWYPGDYNGDGMSDLIKVFDDGGLLSADVYRSTGGGFIRSAWITGQGAFQDEADFILSDVDGDALQDLVYIRRKDYQSRIDVYASTGTGFTHLEDTYAQFEDFGSLRGGALMRRHKYFEPHGIIGPIAADGGGYDAICQSGQDVYLTQGAEYIHTDASTSRFKAYTPQQVLETFEADRLEQFATISRYSLTSHTLLSIDGQNSVLAQKIIGDGRRYDITAAHVTAGFTKGGAHFFGGRNASHHRFNRIYAFNSVGQTAFKIQEADNAYKNIHKGNRIENCFVFGAGVDPRGNGSNPELLSSWADAIGLTSRETVIRNNVVIDGTDVGIVAFTAPDSVIRDNVVATISRSGLGGINLLDTLFYDQWGINGADPEGRIQYDFSTLVQSNYLDSRGARIDIGIPVGWRTWAPPSDPSIDNPYGINIVNNELDGEAFGYGIAIANAFNVTATGNVSVATHSGQGGYFNVPHLIPDPASAFAYAPLHTFNGTYGAEFSAASPQNGLDFLLFNSSHSRTPTPDGYLFVAYTAAEAVATVELAFLEMLHRLPDAGELTVHTNDLISTMSRSDELRVDLMQLPEFDGANPSFTGDKTVNGMQLYRTGVWLENLKLLDAISYNTEGNIPVAKPFYQDALEYLKADYIPAGSLFMTVLPGGLSLEYEGALVTSTNLQSWQAMEPQPGSPVLIIPDEDHRFFKVIAE